MRKILWLILLLLSTIPAEATTTVTGTLQNLGTGTVGQAAFVRFWLRGCGGNIPRVNGTAIIAPSQGGTYFFDLVAASNGAISGTLYSTRDSTGLLAGDIECGGSKTAVWYGMQVWLNGKAGAEIPIHAKSGVTLDITQATPITTNPVVTAPTGDGTYLRLDAGNSPVTGNTQFSGNLTVSGTGTFMGLTGITNAGAFTDSAMDEYFSSKINSPNTQTMFQYFYPPGSFNTAAITGAVVVPVGATKQQATGVHGYVDCASGASGTPCVAVAGYGRVTGTNSHTFGFNTIVADNAATPSTNMFGYENDVNINSASSNAIAQLISGVWTAQCGACYGWVLNKPVAGSGGPYAWTFGYLFQVGATAAPGANNAAIYFNPVASGVNQQSQGMEFVANDPSSGQNLGSFNLLANGNYLASMSKAGAVFQVNQGISANSAAANGILNSVVGVASGLLPPITSTDAAVVGDGAVTLGSGSGKTYGVIGVARANGDASGDKAFGGWFKASAQNTISAEVGLHTETSDPGAILIEAQQGTNKAVLSSTLPTGTSNVTLDAANNIFSGVQNFTGNTVALTADWTCGTGGTVSTCAAATIIGSGGGVPLTFTLPLATRSYTLECDGVVGQATAATANQWNLLTATNGATNVTANYSMATAATASAFGAVTDQASTTTTFQIAPSWTLGGTATKMPFHIWAKVEGASASGTVLSLQLLAPTPGDLVTIYRGASCRVF